MSLLAAALAALVAGPSMQNAVARPGIGCTPESDSVTLLERVDRFDPATGAFLGAERTWFGPDGRRLRVEVTDGEGLRSLLFLLLHDDQGRESGAVYLEGDSPAPQREEFTYSVDGKVQTTTYYAEPGVAGERTVAELDADGREILKRYYRADGTQYGEEAVLWDAAGNQLGWDFRYVERQGGASFRYTYEAFDGDEGWVRRSRSRDAAVEFIEIRSRACAEMSSAVATPSRFAPGSISTDASETSPSLTRDGRTMVFARYEEDWTLKEPYIAYLEGEEWQVERLTGIGYVYNLTISPDGRAVVYAVRQGGERRPLFRVQRQDSGWSTPENLTESYGIEGTYPALTDEGHLLFFDAMGARGAGVYLALREGDGFASPRPLYVPEDGTNFDAFAESLTGPMLLSRCLDEPCTSEGMNGIWEVELQTGEAVGAHKVPGLPYAWGVQPVAPLGVLVFTDGEDILAVPLESAGLTRH